jgi:hypothetical protein
MARQPSRGRFSALEITAASGRKRSAARPSRDRPAVTPDSLQYLLCDRFAANTIRQLCTGRAAATHPWADAA